MTNLIDLLELGDPGERLRYDAVVWRRRRQGWFKRQDWGKSKKGNPWINAYGWNVVIFKRWSELGEVRGFGWRLLKLQEEGDRKRPQTIQDELDELEPAELPAGAGAEPRVVFSTKIYETAEEAALAAFDWMRRDERERAAG